MAARRRILAQRKAAEQISRRPGSGYSDLGDYKQKTHTLKMSWNPRRGVRQTDLPLTLKVEQGGQGYQYCIYRSDSSIVERSTLSYSTQAFARSEGQKILQRRQAAAKPAKQKPPS